MELTQEEKDLILKLRSKKEIFEKIKDLIKDGLLEIKEIEEFIKSIKPKSNRGRKKNN